MKISDQISTINSGNLESIEILILENIKNYSI